MRHAATMSAYVAREVDDDVEEDALTPIDAPIDQTTFDRALEQVA